MSVDENLEKVEEYIRNLTWSDQATEHEKTLVAGNIRSFYASFVVPSITDFIDDFLEENNHRKKLSETEKREFWLKAYNSFPHTFPNDLKTQFANNVVELINQIETRKGDSIKWKC